MFKKGQSGNPGGRPKVIADLQALARSHTETAINALVAIVTSSESDSARVSAASALLDRGYGRAHQESTVTIDDKRDATDWTREELVAFLNDAKAGSNGAVKANGGGREPDSVH